MSSGHEVCKHCGLDIRRTDNPDAPYLWEHVMTGRFLCRPGGGTVAEPAGGR